MKANTKRNIRGILIFLAVCLVISLIVLAVLAGTGVIRIGSEGISFSTELFESIKSEPYFIGFFNI